MARRPLDAQLHATHRQCLRAAELHRRLRGSDHLAQRALRVAEHVRLLRWHAVDQKVLEHLEYQMLELDVAWIDERDLEPMQVEVRAVGAGEDARGAVMG